MWIPVILYFLLGLVVSAPAGVASYFLGRWFRRVKPVWANVVDCFVALLGLVIFNLNLVLVGPLCFGGALAERNLEGGNRSMFSHFVRVLSSASLPTLLVGFAWLELSLMFPTNYDALSKSLSPYFAALTTSEAVALWCGTAFGLMAMPPAIPTALWMWQSSKLKPGLDRPFYSNEKVG